MERVKIVRESWIPKEERLEYPTFNKEDTVLAELIMRSCNSKFSNYDGEGDLFQLTFKKNGKGKVYLAKAF